VQRLRGGALLCLIADCLLRWAFFVWLVCLAHAVTTSPGSVLFRAVDTKLPLIRIHTRQREALVGKRIVVNVDSWEPTSRYPNGHYVRTLGDVGDKEVETQVSVLAWHQCRVGGATPPALMRAPLPSFVRTQVLLLEHDIPAREFSAAVMACLPPANWSITAENSVGRRDLRDICVMSIDPPGCKDIDDALHVRRLPNGNFEVGVHIADVTYFVHHGTAIDVEAADRSNTTYLVERRLDMLPVRGGGGGGGGGVLRGGATWLLCSRLLRCGVVWHPCVGRTWMVLCANAWM